MSPSDDVSVTPLSIRVDDRSDPVTVHLEGEVDPSTTSALTSQVIAIARERQRVCLNVPDLTFIESSGIDDLVRTGLDLRPDSWVRVQHPTDGSRQLVITIGLGELSTGPPRAGD